MNNYVYMRMYKSVIYLPYYHIYSLTLYPLCLFPYIFFFLLEIKNTQKMYFKASQHVTTLVTLLFLCLWTSSEVLATSQTRNEIIYGKDNVIEYRIAPDCILFLIEDDSDVSRLFKLPFTAYSNEFIQSRAVIKLLIHSNIFPGTCTYILNNGTFIDSAAEWNILLVDLFKDSEVTQIQCTKRMVVTQTTYIYDFKFFQSASPSQLLLNYDQLMIESNIYPYVDIDYLGTWTVQNLKIFNQLNEIPHTFLTYSAPHTGMYSLATNMELTQSCTQENVYLYSCIQTSDESNEIHIALAADWGSGTQTAEVVAQFLQQYNSFNPQYTIHVGDIYPDGVPKDVESNFLGEVSQERRNKSPDARAINWPRGSLGSYALLGNHEMLSGGYGFFDSVLPALKQGTSYFGLSNKWWKVLGLDTGYLSLTTFQIVSVDAGLPPNHLQWLREQAQLNDPTDTRGIIVLSHHPPWDLEIDQLGKTAQQLCDMLKTGTRVLWLAGHIHGLYFHGEQTICSATDPDRCIIVVQRVIGNGAMPQLAEHIADSTNSSNLIAYDNRIHLYKNEGKTEAYGVYSGFVHMTLQQNKCILQYYTIQYDVDGTPLNTTSPNMVGQEQWTSIGDGNVELNSIQMASFMTQIVAL